MLTTLTFQSVFTKLVRRQGKTRNFEKSFRRPHYVHQRTAAVYVVACGHFRASSRTLSPADQAVERCLCAPLHLLQFWAIRDSSMCRYPGEPSCHRVLASVGGNSCDIPTVESLACVTHGAAESAEHHSKSDDASHYLDRDSRV